MFQFQVWFLPFLTLAFTTALAIPFSRYLAWIMDGHYRAPRFLRWIEARVDTGPQSWKQYAVAMLLFNTLMFVFGFVVLSLQPLMPLNPDGKGMLAPTTIFNSVISFLTNTNLQHYSGEQHLSYFSQLFFVCWNMFLSASVGFCGLAAIIRALRSDPHMGNYYLDMWRVCAYTFVPASLIMGVLLLADGIPMTLEGSAKVATVEPGAMGPDENGQTQDQQEIARGPVAAILPIKHLGTNGGGFFGANSAHPYENPSAWSNFLSVMNFCLYPFALVLMFGRMLRQMRHAWVIFGVMMTMFVVLIAWAVYWDTLHPNPALEAHPAMAGQPLAGLPVDQSLGNLEGKELRFGTSAGATFATGTTSISCGSVNCSARQPESAGRTLAADRHVAQLHLRRQGRGHDQPAVVPDRRRVHRRTHGGTHARVPGQEGRGPGNETGHDRAVGPSDHDSDARRTVRRHRLGHEVHQQPRRARPVGNGLRVQFRLGQQRLGVRRARTPAGD